MQSLRLVVTWLACLLSTAGQVPLIVQPATPAAVAPAISFGNADYPAWREAIRKDDVAKVKELLAARPALALGSDSPGKGWLHLAADKGQEEIVALLLEAKADVNAPGDRATTAGSNETPLHIAARNGHAGVVRRLLAAGANVNARQSSQNTPLHLALQPWDQFRGVEQLASRQETNRTGRIETIRLLCLSGADLSARNRNYNRSLSPIEAANAPGHEHWLDLLLTNARPRTIRDPFDRSLKDIARQHERLEALFTLALAEATALSVPTGKLNHLQALVFHSPPLPRTPEGGRMEPRGYWNLAAAGHAPDIFTCIGLEDLAGVKAWLRENPDQLARTRDPEGRSPLHWALMKGYEEMAGLLLDHGADTAATDPSGRTPLLLAIEAGQLTVLRRMKAAAPRALRDDAAPISALELALLKGHVEIVDWLLDLQPNLNRPCLTGGTLLHLAVRKGLASAAEKLLARGADPKLRDHHERTPLHLAVSVGSELLVDALLKGNAPLDAADEEGRLPLHEAARLGKTALLPKLLPPAALVHQPDKSGRTPLELALLAGHEGAAEILLRQKPDVNRRGPGGTSLLHLAVLSRKPGLVLQLLTADVEISAADDRGRTPLHSAAELGLADILIKLLHARAPTAARDRDGKSALDLALAGGHTPVARLLLQTLDWKPDATARQTTPLHLAAAAGNLELTRELLTISPTPDLLDERGQTPLVLASMSNRWAIIGPLVARGANVNATNAAGQSPLLMAQVGGDFTKVIGLLKLGANLNQGDTNDDTALHLAFKTPIRDNSASVWQAEFQRLTQTNLVPAGISFSSWLRQTNTLDSIEQRIATVRRDGGHFDSYAPSVDRILQEPWKFVLAAGADAKVTNRLGQTPLHFMATRQDFYDQTHTSRVEVIVAELVRRGTDPNGRDATGRTALHEAAQRGRWQLVQSLLRHGADPNASAPDGQAALHHALHDPWPHRNAVLIFPTLIHHGADVNIRDTNGQTVLHHLSRFGRNDIDEHSPVVGEFLLTKPDINVQDKQGDTALHLAVRTRRANLAGLLNSRGANPLLKNLLGETPLAMSATLRLPTNLLVPKAKTDPLTAASVGDLESLKVWFALDPAPIVQTNSAANPFLTEAARNHHANVVDFLLTNGAQPNPFVALHMGRMTLLAEVLRQNPKAAMSTWLYPPRSYRTVTPFGTSSGSVSGAHAPLLHHAASAGNEEAVTLILAQSPGVNATDSSGFSALYHALTNQAAAVVARLRSSGAVENTTDLIAQNKLAQLKSQAANVLVAAPPIPASHNPLTFAIQQTNLAAVKLLLSLGADANMPWPSRYRPPRQFETTNVVRPLHVAVAMEHLELARVLIEHRADVKALEVSGLTPLNLAAWRGHAGLIKLLLEHGADPNARPAASPEEMQRPPPFRPAGHTPLHVSVLFGQTNGIALLVGAGADVERTNNLGQTPLGLLRNDGRSFGMGMWPNMPVSMVMPSISEFQRLPPASRTFSRDEIAHLLRSLGAKESVVGQVSGYSPFGPPRSLPPSSTPNAKAAPAPPTPAKQP